VDLVVYVRNDPVNLMDPDGRDPIRITVSAPHWEPEHSRIETPWDRPTKSGGSRGGGMGDDSRGGASSGGARGYRESDNQTKVKENAVLLAGYYLGSNTCDSLLRGSYQGSLPQLLLSLLDKPTDSNIRYINGQIGKKSGDEISVDIAFTVGRGNNGLIYLNKMGPFENPTNTMMDTAGGIKGFDYLRWFNDTFETSLDADQYRAAIVLHELGHITGAFGPDRGSQSMDNTRNVIKDCIG
jgi:hypothetical protein